MKKIVFFMLAIGVLTSCGSAGNYCATDENNNQEITPIENQQVIAADQEASAIS